MTPAELIGLVRTLIGELTRLRAEYEKVSGALAKLRIEHQAVKDELARLKKLPPWKGFRKPRAVNHSTRARRITSTSGKKHPALYVADIQFRYNNRVNADLYGTAIKGC